MYSTKLRGNRKQMADKKKRKKSTQQRQWNEKNEIDRRDQNKRHDNTIKYFMKENVYTGKKTTNASKYNNM